MKKKNQIPRFDGSKLKKLEDYKIGNLAAIVGGWVIGTSTWSGGGSGGTDTVTQGDTTNWWFDDGQSCQYCDVIDNATGRQLDTIQDKGMGTGGPCAGLPLLPDDAAHPGPKG